LPGKAKKGHCGRTDSPAYAESREISIKTPNQKKNTKKSEKRRKGPGSTSTTGGRVGPGRHGYEHRALGAKQERKNQSYKRFNGRIEKKKEDSECGSKGSVNK